MSPTSPSGVDPFVAPLAGAPVLVTGGASGLGAAVVRGLVDVGARPGVLDLARPAMEVDHEPVDLADGRAAEAAVARLAERLGGLRAVVTAAGIDACGRFEDVEAEAWERVIRVNLVGTAAVVRAALPHLRRTRGQVVTVASTLGLRVLSDATAYSASKFAVVGFTRALAREIGAEVSVTLLVPGGMRTSFFDGRDEQYRPSPTANLCDPAAVARGVLFALSQPPGCTVRELMITPDDEPSWP